ncbi:helix-turn-helix domain-containing protein [Mucilaginibacter sp. SJ]|uniref:helix-turn-helix domain-containing protein n=1 Tax=Mucilaginibacter sp. SJ TaxID=3029053 RepID=UPI0023A9D4E4|nr:helix-turn-helix transcriptional regulator [Mucilaginibacter sp. SJ]WEA01754.1 helix-turn-helix transcriptional regulator [Mucilaginibacter sp. SJ]
MKKDYSELQQKFGNHLKTIREKQNISLRELAAKCDLDHSKIGKIENGQTNLQLSTIFELAKGLGINPKELIDF